MAITRVANIAFFRIDGNGRVISKDSITEPLSSHLTGSYEQRIIEDSSNPSTLGNPTVKEYIEREALADYVVDFMGPDTIITAGAGSAATTIFFETGDADFQTTIHTGGGTENNTLYYSDGTDQTSINLFSNHTFSPNNPPNSAYSILTSPLTYLLVAGQGLTSLSIPPNFSNPTDIIININTGLTAFTTSANWTDLTTLNVRITGITSLTTHAEWVNLEYIDIGDTSITSLELHPEWTSITDLRGRNADITAPNAIEVPSTWTNLDIVYLGVNRNLQTASVPNTCVNITGIYFDSCDLQSFITHPEWVLLEVLALNINADIGNIETHAEWVNLRILYLNQSGQTTLEVHQEWIQIEKIYVYGNSLPASEIDAALIELDASGVSNGEFYYYDNPGEDDGDRSAAALTAKGNLTTKGWTFAP